MKKKLCFAAAILLATAVVCFAVHYAANRTPAGDTSASYNVCSANGVYINDIEEYRKFVNTETHLPEDFITVDKLEAFGTFNGFTCESKTDFADYRYSIDMPNGQAIGIRIQHGNPIDTIIQPVISANKIGMNAVSLTSSDTGMIVRNGIKYNYVNGHLIRMLWTVGDITFSISVSSAWDDYPAFPSDSVIYNMLSAVETEQASAISELQAIITDDNLETE